MNNSKIKKRLIVLSATLFAGVIFLIFLMSQLNRDCTFGDAIRLDKRDSLWTFFGCKVSGPPLKKAIDLGSIIEDAKQGDAKAQYELGKYYEFDQHKQSDAAMWYRKSAEGGNRDAQLLLLRKDIADGKLLTSSDAEKAIARYRQLSAKANQLTQLSEQDRYDALVWIIERDLQNKIPTPEDYREAFNKLLTFAEMGNIRAQTGVCGLYLTGSGVTEDKVEAYFWSRVATLQGPHPPPHCRVRADLTADQISDVEKRLRNWKAVSSASKQPP